MAEFFLLTKKQIFLFFLPQDFVNIQVKNANLYGEAHAGFFSSIPTLQGGDVRSVLSRFLRASRTSRSSLLMTGVIINL